MTADSKDTVEYEPAKGQESEADRRRYWAVAIGLQAVDGLEVSGYLHEVSDAYVKGSYGLEKAGELLRDYHKENPDKLHEEADLVSQRIVELLASKAFALNADFLRTIHAYLLQDLDESIYHPGAFKEERMIKQEEILNGDSVLYADPLTYEASLTAAFAREIGKNYGAFGEEELNDFCQAIAFLWQIHPFYEGNTRTVAVFSALYLNYLGFDVSNEPFEHYSRYYRDALVRATYRNAAAKIFPDYTYLNNFYENAISNANHELKDSDLVCLALFDDPSLLRNVSPSRALKRIPKRVLVYSSLSESQR